MAKSTYRPTFGSVLMQAIQNEDQRQLQNRQLNDRSREVAQEYALKQRDMEQRSREAEADRQTKWDVAKYDRETAVQAEELRAKHVMEKDEHDDPITTLKDFAPNMVGKIPINPLAHLPASKILEAVKSYDDNLNKLEYAKLMMGGKNQQPTSIWGNPIGYSKDGRPITDNSGNVVTLNDAVAPIESISMDDNEEFHYDMSKLLKLSEAGKDEALSKSYEDLDAHRGYRVERVLDKELIQKEIDRFKSIRKSDGSNYPESDMTNKLDKYKDSYYKNIRVPLSSDSGGNDNIIPLGANRLDIEGVGKPGSILPTKSSVAEDMYLPRSSRAMRHVENINTVLPDVDRLIQQGALLDKVFSHQVNYKDDSSDYNITLGKMSTFNKYVDQLLSVFNNKEYVDVAALSRDKEIQKKIAGLQYYRDKLRNNLRNARWSKTEDLADRQALQQFGFENKLKQAVGTGKMTEEQYQQILGNSQYGN